MKLESVSPQCEHSHVRFVYHCVHKPKETHIPSVMYIPSAIYHAYWNYEDRNIQSTVRSLIPLNHFSKFEEPSSEHLRHVENNLVPSKNPMEVENS